MHPFHTISLAHEHIADMASTAERHRRARRARRSRRGGGARSPAPPAAPDGDAVVLSFLPDAHERRPAA
jgi:hypothetical protein